MTWLDRRNSPCWELTPLQFTGVKRIDRRRDFARFAQLQFGLAQSSALVAIETCGVLLGRVQKGVTVQSGRSSTQADSNSSGIHDLIFRAMECQRKLDLKGALQHLTQAHKLQPDNVQVLALAAKQWTDHTFLPGVQRKDKVACNERAIVLAKAAQKLDASYSLGHSAECIAKGRLAEMDRNPKRVLELAKEAQEAAFRALHCDHQDDIAHHLMGRFNYGMATLNTIVRQLIKLVFGAEFASGTLPDALACYQAAVALRPDRVIHRVELGRVMLALGHHQDASEHLQAAFKLPVEDINAQQMLRDALEMMQRISSDVSVEHELSDVHKMQAYPALASLNCTPLLGHDVLLLDNLGNNAKQAI